jgi:hypothetical protein
LRGRSNRDRRPIGRWHVCENPECRKRFRPRRGDAKYHNDSCRLQCWQARRKAEAQFKTKQSAEMRLRIFLRGRERAVWLVKQVSGIESIATEQGLLVGETVPGAIAKVRALLPRWQESPCGTDVSGLIRLAPMPSYPTPYDRHERQHLDMCYRATESVFLGMLKEGAIRSISHFLMDPAEYPLPDFQSWWDVVDRRTKYRRDARDFPTAQLRGAQLKDPDEFDPRDGEVQKPEPAMSMSDWLDEEWLKR